LSAAASPISSRSLSGIHGRRSRSHALRSDRLLLGFTVGRLALIPGVVASFLVSPAITTAFLLLFIAADVFDGVLARRFEADGPSRRALDSIVDRIAIDACLVAAWVSGAMPLLILCGLLARDLYLAVLCRKMVRERGVAIKADWLYRSLNLGVAAWALLAPFISQGGRTVLAVALLGFSLIVARDLKNSISKILQASPELRNVVVGADVLRGTSDLSSLRHIDHN
jgi:phosphatidylglycerophosphate synthase